MPTIFKDARVPVDFEGLRDVDGNVFAPATLEDAVEFLYTSMDDKEKAFVRTEGARQLHHGLGRTMRNAWMLWEDDKPLVQNVTTRFRCLPGDDVSDKILQALEKRVGYEGARVVNGAGQQARGSNTPGGSIPPPRANIIQRIRNWFR